MSNKYHSAIVKEVAKKTGKPIKDVNVIINKFLIGISDSLREGDGVTIRDFGFYKVSKRAARNYRNPRTGVMVKAPEKDIVTFKPSNRILEYSQIYKD